MHFREQAHGLHDIIDEMKEMHRMYVRSLGPRCTILIRTTSSYMSKVMSNDSSCIASAFIWRHFNVNVKIGAVVLKNANVPKHSDFEAAASAQISTTSSTSTVLAVAANATGGSDIALSLRFTGTSD